MKPRQSAAIKIPDRCDRSNLKIIKPSADRKRKSKLQPNDFLITFQVKGDKFEEILRKSIRSIIIEELSFFVNQNKTPLIEYPSQEAEDMPVLVLNNYRQLTAKEIEVMDLVLLDFTNRKIAARLNIKYNTEKNHIKNINNKLGVTDRKAACCVYSRLYKTPGLTPK